MCICINCNYVNNCVGYHKVESKHNEVNLNLKPSFYPQNPIINIIVNQNNEMEWDVIDCLSFIESPGYWMELY